MFFGLNVTFASPKFQICAHSGVMVNQYHVVIQYKDGCMVIVNEANFIYVYMVIYLSLSW